MKNKKQNKKSCFNHLNVDEIVLNCAVRYALGRRTYIVSTVCDEIKNNILYMSDNCLENLKKDIKRQGEDAFAMPDPYGAKCDEENWMEVLEWINNEQEKRRKQK